MRGFDRDRFKANWERVLDTLVGPQGWGGLSLLARQALAAPLLHRIVRPASLGADAEGRSLWLGWAAPSSAEQGLDAICLFPMTGHARGRAVTSTFASLLPGPFFRRVRQVLEPLAGHHPELILETDEPLPMRMVLLASRSVGIAVETRSPLQQEPHAQTSGAVTSSNDRAPRVTGGTPLAAGGVPDTTFARGVCTSHDRLLPWIQHLLTDNPEPHEPKGVVATHHPARTTVHVPEMMGFRSGLFKPSEAEAAQADLFYRWGVRRTFDRQRLSQLAVTFDAPMFVVEDGLFLRSFGLGVGDDREMASSISVDTQTAYYDITCPSRLEARLRSDHELTAPQLSRAESCIEGLTRSGLSKYNHAPRTTRRLGRRGRPKTLLVDQRYLDASVRFGLASTRHFDDMLRFAVHERPHHDLLLKRHPDATLGGVRSYFSSDRLARLPVDPGRLTLLDEEINPHSLLDQVDEVFVVTSGLGFEAALRGLPVRCFGSPFYAGWGFTRDHQEVPRRPRERTPVELFHYAAIEAATYWAPESRSVVSLESAMERMAALRRRAGHK